MDDFVLKLGQAIRELRTKKKLSQEKLALKANLHRTYIGAIERGEKIPTILTVHKIMLALEITEESLFRVTYQKLNHEYDENDD